MKEYVNKIGCSVSFEDGISDEQIKIRLKWLGGEWSEKE